MRTFANLYTHHLTENGHLHIASITKFRTSTRLPTCTFTLKLLKVTVPQADDKLDESA